MVLKIKENNTLNNNQTSLENLTRTLSVVQMYFVQKEP